MSTNLDKSLDEILATRKTARNAKKTGSGAIGGIRKRPQRAAAAKATASISQGTTKASAKGSPAGQSSKGDASKIIVSNLPYDVNELMIKEYFSKVVGPVKTCSLSYGPNGQSRGIATITFVRSGDAENAALSYNNVLVDKRPMKVELVLEPKLPGLETRVGAPNKIKAAPKTTQAKPKPVTPPSNGPSNRGTAARGGRGGRKRGGRGSGRSKPKTAEELDAEMADYWVGGAAPQAGTQEAQYNTAPVASGDAMDDEVLVGKP